ncbi:hypothetical protein SCWH03_05180 [Streptomyces pacificus]|uniref:Uncharacterized protein n=1 Tax=Streptomyces pacificus TaxID=2705029 RepID=A0A6A0AQZ5_9ACTN|nr:hypothetical protein SCWH03_05180 [Streptomyces pacificus]
MSGLTIPPEVIPLHLPELRAWVEANGLDPHDLPMCHPIRVEEGEGGAVIRYRAFVRDADGRKQVDPGNPDEVWTEERTVPCAVPPPRLGGSATSAPEQRGGAGRERVGRGRGSRGQAHR